MAQLIRKHVKTQLHRCPIVQSADTESVVILRVSVAHWNFITLKLCMVEDQQAIRVGKFFAVYVTERKREMAKRKKVSGAPKAGGAKMPSAGGKKAPTSGGANGNSNSGKGGKGK